MLSQLVPISRRFARIFFFSIFRAVVAKSIAFFGGVLPINPETRALRFLEESICKTIAAKHFVGIITF